MSSSSQSIILMSSDKEIFEIEQSIASQSQLIKHMIEDDCIETAIPLANISSKILSKVIEFCEKHDNSADDLKNWDADFLKVLDHSTLFEVILAADYLDIKPLLNLTCKAVAGMIRGKTPEEIRRTFNIENDFTPEEEEEVRKENEWAFN